MPKKSATNNVGTFRLGNMAVSVVADPSLEGGSYTAMPSPVITVGFNQNSWQEAVGVLLHEALEYSYMIRGHKFRSVPMSGYDSADCTFWVNHAEFGRSCMDVGCFMAEALPALHKAYMKELKRKK